MAEVKAALLGPLPLTTVGMDATSLGRESKRLAPSVRETLLFILEGSGHALVLVRRTIELWEPDLRTEARFTIRTSKSGY